MAARLGKGGTARNHFRLNDDIPFVCEVFMVVWVLGMHFGGWEMAEGLARPLRSGGPFQPACPAEKQG